MDALQPILEGPIKTGKAGRRDLKATHKPHRAERVKSKHSSRKSKRTPETGLATQENQRGSEEIKSCAPGCLQAKETFMGNGEAFSQTPKLSMPLRSPPEKLQQCEQCGKGLWGPSELTQQHQRVASRQKAAKRTQSPSEAYNRCPLKPTPVTLEEESMFTVYSKVLMQNSEVTADQSSCQRRYFCDQCGKAFRYPSDLSRHQKRGHSRPKATKRSRSPSEADSPSLLESTLLALQTEGTFPKSSKASRQKSKARTGQNTRPKKRHFCDQCGKAFSYPSDVARHQRRVHSGQKTAKWDRPPSETDGSSPFELTAWATLVENTSINSSPVLGQDSKVTTNQGSPCREQCSCDQCGKAFWYPSKLTQHRCVHSRQKVAEGSQSSSEVDSPRLLESPLLALQKENTFTKPSKQLFQKSKAGTGWDNRPRKWYFCSQCGKGCRKPSELARHERVHSRRKAAKWAQSPPEADQCSPLELSQLITLVANISIHSSKASRQNSDQSGHSRRWCLCDQCGKAFWYPSSLARHQRLRCEQRAVEQVPSESEADSPSSALQAKNVLASSSRTLAKKSKATTEQSPLPRRRLFGGRPGKAVRSPDFGRHRGVRSRQKWILSQSEADSPASWAPTPAEPPVEVTLTSPSKALHQNSKATTDQSSRYSRLYLCDQCGKTYRYPSDLARHQHVHSGWKADDPLPEVPQSENPPANWGEAVPPSSTLTTDRNTRTKKPYLCDQCGEGFRWRSELAQHQYTHFQECPYACVICGRQFRRRVQLEKHHKWHEDGQDEEEGGEMFPSMDADDSTGEYTPREVLQRESPPKRTEELREPSVSPETCECGACNTVPDDNFGWLPGNSIWEIGMTGQPYLLPLPPAGEYGSCETNREGGGSPWPAEPSLLQAEVASSTTLVSAASSGEIFTSTPTVPAASPGAQGASKPKDKTSPATVAVRRVARPPQIGSPDPEWLPSLNHPRRPRKPARSSARGPELHSCPVCLKLFKSAAYLKRHLDVHQPGKPYSCTLCGESFGRRSYLLKHRRKHGLQSPSPQPAMQPPLISVL